MFPADGARALVGNCPSAQGESPHFGARLATFSWVGDGGQYFALVGCKVWRFAR